MWATANCRHTILQVNPDIRKEKWTEQEDNNLIQLVNMHGSCWAEIARGMAVRLCIGRALFGNVCCLSAAGCSQNLWLVSSFRARTTANSIVQAWVQVHSVCSLCFTAIVVFGDSIAGHLEVISPDMQQLATQYVPDGRGERISSAWGAGGGTWTQPSGVARLCQPPPYIC
jgi:Myb-like DNA-binding domain